MNQTINPNKPSLSQEQYANYVKLAAIAASTTALILLILKLYAWFVSDASAMLASATDSLLDLFASVTNIFILRFALAPADADHRFGHGKAESLAGFAQSAFIMGSAILLVINGVQRTLNPQVIEHTEIGIWVTLIAIIMTLLLVIMQNWVIKRTDSLVISADSIHYKSDLLLNFGVLVALFLSQGIWIYADGIFTTAVGLYLILGAVQIIRVSIEHLMDKELTEAEVDQIKRVVLAQEGVLGLHELRTRRAGPQRFIQFHLELDDDLLLVEAHEIGDPIEQKLIEIFSPCEIFIHHDPSSIAQVELTKNEIDSS